MDAIGGCGGLGGEHTPIFLRSVCALGCALGVPVSGGRDRRIRTSNR